MERQYHPEAMNTRHLLFSLVALLGLAPCSAQHTPITTQYLFNGLLINPAYAGSREALTANLTCRQQWVGFEGAPQTGLLSLHSPVPSTKLSFGLMVAADRIGVSRQTAVMSNYAYRVRLGSGKLAFGLGAGLKMQHHAWSTVVTTDPGDEQFLADSPRQMSPEFSGGVYWANKQYFVGLSLPVLPRTIVTADSTGNRGRLLEGGQPMLTAGTVFAATEGIKLKPSFLLRKASGASIQGDLNLNVIWRDRFWTGLSWRSNDALCLLLEFLPTQQLRLGYSYDMGLGRLAHHHQGLHEVMIQYEFGFRVKAKDPRYF